MRGKQVYNKTTVVNPVDGKQHREYCRRVNGVYKKPRVRPDPVAGVAGDGQYGFPTRFNDHEVGERKTAVGPRKRGCKLASRNECRSRDALAERIAEKVRKTGKPRWRARKGQKLHLCR